MKSIIGGKLYDTKTAVFVGSYQYSYPNDFEYYYEALYRKKNGEYFLYGKGGCRSCYSKSVSSNSCSGGEEIIPMDLEEAKEWAEAKLDTDDYIKEFGEPAE